MIQRLEPDNRRLSLTVVQAGKYAWLDGHRNHAKSADLLRNLA